MPAGRSRSPLGTLLWSVGIASVGAVLLALTLIPIVQAPGDAPTGQLVGQPAPALAGETLDGGSWSVADVDGRLLWVNFWAISCPPCRAEMPAMQRLAELHAGELQVIGVNWGEERAAVRDFATRLAIDYPILLDPRHDNFDRWAIGGWLPRHYFVRDGLVVHEVIGELRPSEMASTLSKLLDD